MSSLNMATDAHGIGAGVAEVGVLDMLKFQNWTIGRAWVPDFGCSEDPEDFDYLIKISPLQNVDEKKAYPATFLLTADHDDRVSPAHSFKMAAELQHKLPKNPNPILLRVDIDAGHGAGKSTQRRIEEAADSEWRRGEDANIHALSGDAFVADRFCMPRIHPHRVRRCCSRAQPAYQALTAGSMLDWRLP